MEMKTRPIVPPEWLEKMLNGEPPHFVIGDPDNPYMRRWHLVPRNERSNIYLHNILRDDDDRALHDHPWDNTTVVLSGVLDDIHTLGLTRTLYPGNAWTRRAHEPHRLVVVEPPVWTIFFTGPIVRRWGFHTPDGWVHWKEFLASRGEASAERKHDTQGEDKV